MEGVDCRASRRIKDTKEGEFSPSVYDKIVQVAKQGG